MTSQTFYLRSADAIARASDRAARGTPTPKPVAKTAPVASPPPKTEPMVAVEPDPEPRVEPPPPSIADSAAFRKLSYAEQVSQLQAELLKRIDALPNDRADSACLILQIIPRESVFDRSVNPRAKLLDYAQQVTTVNDLLDIEKAINSPKG